jgi:hypothetical protein
MTTTNTISELIKQANALGADAFATGGKRAPAASVKFDGLMKANRELFNANALAVLDAFLNGWDAANLANPVPSELMARATDAHSQTRREKNRVTLTAAFRAGFTHCAILGEYYHFFRSESDLNEFLKLPNVVKADPVNGALRVDHSNNLAFFD